MKKSHYLIYGCGVAISLLFIGLFFINPDNPWCVVSCSTGGSLIGAVVLGFFIDLSNARNKANQSKRVFEIAHIDMFGALHSLLMIVYHPLKEFYFITENSDTFRYENLTIKGLIQKYVDAINEIGNILNAEQGETLSQEKRERIAAAISEYKDEIFDFRLKFRRIWENARQQQNVLIANDSSFETDIKKAIAALEILCKTTSDKAKDDELIELGKSFKELIETGNVDVLEKIGFGNVRFKNDKGFFNIELEQR